MGVIKFEKREKSTNGNSSNNVNISNSNDSINGNQGSFGITDLYDQKMVDTLEFLLNQAKEGKIEAFTATYLNDMHQLENLYGGNIEDNYIGFAGMISNMQIDLKGCYNEKS